MDYNKKLEKLFTFANGENADIRNPISIKIRPYKKDSKAVILTLVATYYPRYRGNDGVIGMVNSLLKLFSKSKIEELVPEVRKGCDTCDYGTFYSRGFVLYD